MGGPGSGNKSVLEMRSKRDRKSYANRVLPEEKVQQMFATYCQLPNFRHVSRACGVDIASVKKYWTDGRWEERRQQILDEARKKVDLDIVSATTKSLTMVQRMKEKIEEKIHELATSEISTSFLVSDLERLVKLEQLLLGGVADRKETILTTHEERVRLWRENREKDITPPPKALQN